MRVNSRGYLHRALHARRHGVFKRHHPVLLGFSQRQTDDKVTLPLVHLGVISYATTTNTLKNTTLYQESLPEPHNKNTSTLSGLWD